MLCEIPPRRAPSPRQFASTLLPIWRIVKMLALIWIQAKHRFIDFSQWLPLPLQWSDFCCHINNLCKCFTFPIQFLARWRMLWWIEFLTKTDVIMLPPGEIDISSFEPHELLLENAADRDTKDKSIINPTAREARLVMQIENNRLVIDRGESENVIGIISSITQLIYWPKSCKDASPMQFWKFSYFLIFRLSQVIRETSAIVHSSSPNQVSENSIWSISSHRCKHQDASLRMNSIFFAGSLKLAKSIFQKSAANTQDLARSYLTY